MLSPDRRRGRLAVALAFLVLTLLTSSATGQGVRPRTGLPPNDVPGLAYTNAFFPGTTYRTNVPTQASIIGFATGERAASAAEVDRCLKAWAEAAPDRTRLVEYARSHEGRPLSYLVVTAPKHRARLDQIQADLARLGDPRNLSEADAGKLIDSLPAVVWLAYTIHGDETEGSDAALAVLYHLLAAEDPAVSRLLDELVIIIDPLMNPDGRDRFVKMIAENRGALPNVDDQSQVHEGYWPYGRGNHYLFDLNRDWALGVHPETRGRMREVGKWHPQLFVDAHGMGAQDTHLFSPPREPINPNMPAGRENWGRVFSADQARAMDRSSFLYYNGEWNEEWYPGYSDGWASYRGAVGILYEQARIAEDGVRRPGGRILSYRESVQHHVTGSLANITTAATNARALREYFHQTRKVAVDPAGRYGRRTFAVLPTANAGRLGAFTDLMALQGFEMHELTAPWKLATATDQLGRAVTNRQLPAGTLLIPNRQPLGHLVAALLEFDPQFKPEVVADEREELLRKGESKIYDTTAWNLTMLFGLEALTLPEDLPAGTRTYAAPAPPTSTRGTADNAVAFVIDGEDDRAVTVAARLMEQGVEVRSSDKAFRLDDREFARGSVIVTRLDNRRSPAEWPQLVARTAEAVGVQAVAVTTGFGAGDLPDLGGRHFRRLEPPRLGLFTRGRFSPGDYGSIWYVLDHRLGIRHSHLDEANPGDLGRYNVLVLPETYGALSPSLLESLKTWVREGGTLIAIGAAVNPVIGPKAEFSRTRGLGDVLDRLPEYELTVLREWQGRTRVVPAPDKVWAHTAGPGLEYPWQLADGPQPDEKELKKREAWQSLFMPQGAFAAGRVDTNHWLTTGCGEVMTVMAESQPVLMATDGVEAPIRYGYLLATAVQTNRTEAASTNATAAPKPAEGGTIAKSDAAAKGDPEKPGTDGAKKEKKEASRLGWCALPPGTEMYLRESGLLWPEAAARIANSAVVTREGLGRGQIILFANSPTFRGAARGTTRVFLNAVVAGPGWGAAQPVRP